MKLDRLKQAAYRRRRWLIAVGAAAAFVALTVALLPIGIRYGLVTWLEEDGARTASIENVDFNPFTGALLVEGLEVSEQTGRGMNVSRLFLNLEMLAVARKHIHLRALEIEDGAIGIAFDTGAGPRLVGLPAAEDPDEPEEPSSWRFGVDSLAIRDLEARLYLPEGESAVAVQALKIDRFAQWEADVASPFDIAGEFAGGSARIVGETLAFQASPSLSAQVSLEGIELARLKPLLGLTGLGAFAGKLSANVRANLALEKLENLAASAEGSLTLDAPAVDLLSDRSAGSPASAEGGESGGPAAAPPPSGGSTPTRVGAERAGISDFKARFSLGANGALRLSLTSATRSAGLKVETGSLAIDSKELRWDGSLDLARLEAGAATLGLKGEFLGTDVSLGIERSEGSKPLRYAFNEIAIRALDGTLREEASGDIGAAWESEIAFNGVEGLAPRSSLRGEAITWSGRLEAARRGPATWGVSGKGQLESRDLALALPDDGLDITQKTTRWDGTFAYRTGDGSGKPMLALDAAAHASGTRIDSSELGIRLLALDEASLDGIAADGRDKILIDMLSLHRLEILQPLKTATGAASEETAQNQFAAVETLTAKDVALTDGSHLVIGSVRVENADVTVVRGPEGDWRLLGSVLKALGGAEEEKPAAGAPDGGAEDPPFSFAIGEWSVTGGSRLSFIDRSVEPAVEVSASPVKVRIAGIDSRKPRRESAVEIAGQLGTYGRFDLSGTFKPLTPRLNLDVEGNVQGLELPALQGYARQYLGYNLTRGRLDAEIEARIVEGKLEADSNLVLSRLQVEPADSERARPMNRQIEVPLETALALLRNRDDVIRLNIPVTGDAASPKFDFSNAINTAIGNAVKRTMLTTVKLAFPLGGAILTLAQAAKGAARLRFEPVPFPEAGARLSQDAEAYLAEMAKLLKERPGVRITVCGAVTEADRAALYRRALERLRSPAAQPRSPDPAAPAPPSQAGAVPPVLADLAAKEADARMADLARERSEAVKNHLMARHGIEEARIFLCAPKDEPDADRAARPRADVYI